MGMYESRPCHPFVHTTTNGKWMLTPKKKRIGKMVFDTSRNNVSFHTSVLDPGALKALRGTSPNDRKSEIFFSASKPMMPYDAIFLWKKAQRPHLEWFFSKNGPIDLWSSPFPTSSPGLPSFHVPKRRLRRSPASADVDITMSKRWFGE